MFNNITSYVIYAKDKLYIANKTKELEVEWLCLSIS